ncbi:hypothetical protein ACS0TY_030735 [Phlomoides rotata]
MEDEVLDLGEIPGVESAKGALPVCLAGRLITEKKYNQFSLIDVSKAFQLKGTLKAGAWGKGLVRGVSESS